MRNLRKSDASSICHFANDRKIFRYTILPYPYTIKDAEKFIPYAHKNLKDQNSFELGITLIGKDEVIGMIGIKHIDRDNKLSAELGYWLGRKYWRQGIMFEAVWLMLDFAFNDINLHKVFAKAMEPNKASSRLLEKAGFKREGLLREYEKRAGKWMNVYYLGLLKKEFKKKQR